MKYAAKEGLTQQTDFLISRCIRFRWFPGLPEQGVKEAVRSGSILTLPKLLVLQLYWIRYWLRNSQSTVIRLPTTQTGNCRPISISHPGSIPYNRRKNTLPSFRGCVLLRVVTEIALKFFIKRNEKYTCIIFVNVLLYNSLKRHI